VRKEHLVEVGKRVRLKQNRACSRAAGELDGTTSRSTSFPRSPGGIQSRWKASAAGPHLTGRGSATTRRRRDPVDRARHGGYGKVALLEELRRSSRWATTGDLRGRRRSDIHVMLHVNRLNGLTIASPEKQVPRADCQAHGPER